MAVWLCAVRDIKACTFKSAQTVAKAAFCDFKFIAKTSKRSFGGLKGEAFRLGLKLALRIGVVTLCYFLSIE